MQLQHNTDLGWVCPILKPADFNRTGLDFSTCIFVNRREDSTHLIYSMILAKAKARERDKGIGRGEEDRIVSSLPVSFSAPAQRAACIGSYTPPADNTEIAITHTLCGVPLWENNERWVVWYNLTWSGLTFSTPELIISQQKHILKCIIHLKPQQFVNSSIFMN